MMDWIYSDNINTLSERFFKFALYQKLPNSSTLIIALGHSELTQAELE